MIEKISEILKDESGKSKMQRLRERKKSLLVVAAILYFSAFFTEFFGKTPLEEGIPFVSLIFIYYVFFIIFSPLPPSEFLTLPPFLRWSIWLFVIGILPWVTLNAIFIFKQSFYLAVITILAFWAFVSIFPIAYQVFWSRTLAKNQK